MTVETLITRTVCEGDSSTDTWDFNITYYDVDDISVWKYDATLDVATELESGTDYTLSMPQDDEQKVTYLGSTLPTGDRLVVLRDVDMLQSQNFDNDGPFYASDHENALDRAIYRTQQISDARDRAIKVGINDLLTVEAQVDSGVADNDGAALVVGVTDDVVNFEFYGDANAATIAEEKSAEAVAYIAPTEANKDATLAQASLADTSAIYASEWETKVQAIGVLRSLSVVADQSANHSAAVQTFVPVTDAITVTLPAADTSGNEVVVKNATGGALTIAVDCTGTDSIDGSSVDGLLTAYECWKYMSDGEGEWMIMGGSAGEIDPMPMPLITCDEDGSNVTVASPVAPAGKVVVTMNDGTQAAEAAPVTFDSTGGSAGTFTYMYAIPSGRYGFAMITDPSAPEAGGPAAYTVHRYLGAVWNIDASTVARFTQSRDRFMLIAPVPVTFGRYLGQPAITDGTPQSAIASLGTHIASLIVRKSSEPECVHRINGYQTAQMTDPFDSIPFSHRDGHGQVICQSTIHDTATVKVSTLTSSKYIGAKVVGWTDRWLQR